MDYFRNDSKIHIIEFQVYMERRLALFHIPISNQSKALLFKINGISNQMRNSMNGASVLLRVRSTRITAVCISLHDVSLPVCIIVIGSDITTC